MAKPAIATVDENYRGWLDSRPREALGRRTLATHGSFLVDHLRPGMRVLDVGCGPGSITRDIASRVTPGQVIGIDAREETIAAARVAALDRGPEELVFDVGEASALEFDDDSFDVVFMHALLQHVTDPLRVLQECRRVVAPTGMIAVADTDLSAVVIHPTNPTLEAYIRYLVRLREHSGGSPNVGRQLRTLLHAAGFEASIVAVDAAVDGDPDSVAFTAEAFAGPLEAQPLIEYVEAHEIATREELAQMAGAWREWAADPGAMWTRMWLHAIGRPAPIDP